MLRKLTEIPQEFDASWKLTVMTNQMQNPKKKEKKEKNVLIISNF